MERRVRQAVPLITELLDPVARDDGLVVAIADLRGTLRSITGSPSARRRTEAIGFTEGENWSTASAGRNAPGLALTNGTPVTVSGPEHTREDVHRFSCSAVPLVDPRGGTLLGALDVTGGSVAANRHVLSLVRATAAAIEREWLVHPDTEPVRNGGTACLRLLGCTRPQLEIDGVVHPLSNRHAELLTLLATHPQGLDTDSLRQLAYDDHTPTATIRVELLRLRRKLEAMPGAPGLASRPYRLTEPIIPDAVQVTELLARGDREGALDLYRGAAAPGLEAAPVLDLLRATSGALRESILEDGDADSLMRFLQLPEAADDLDAWRLALQILPPQSARRALVLTHLESREA